MQTFLPYPSFEKSAAVLDMKRLGKQRSENWQIMQALILGIGHPSILKHWVTNAWRGYEWSLLMYQYAICREWHINRGYVDNTFKKTYELFWRLPYLYVDRVDYPWWFGDEDLHLAQRSNLLRKKPEHYGPIFEPGLANDLPYVHPV